MQRGTSFTATAGSPVRYSQQPGSCHVAQIETSTRMPYIVSMWGERGCVLVLHVMRLWLEHCECPVQWNALKRRDNKSSREILHSYRSRAMERYIVYTLTL